MEFLSLQRWQADAGRLCTHRDNAALRYFLGHRGPVSLFLAMPVRLCVPSFSTHKREAQGGQSLVCLLSDPLFTFPCSAPVTARLTFGAVGFLGSRTSWMLPGFGQQEVQTGNWKVG